MPPYKSRIADWPEDDRPREKLIKRGTDALSDAELLAIILRIGATNLSALDLARKLLLECNGFRGMDRMEVDQLTRIPGIGSAKAAQIKSALAIGKRLAEQRRPDAVRVTCSNDVYELVNLKYRDRKREVFGIILLTSRNKVIEEKVLFQGSVTESLVSPREVIREIIDAGAAQAVFVHNHPSGESSPSESDLRVTELLVAACKAIDVQVLDHLIVGDGTYYSFADAGKLK